MGSIPGKVKFLNFQNFNSFQVLVCCGVYIDTFGLKFQQPLWFSGSVLQPVDHTDAGSIPDSKVGEGRGGRPRNSLVA